MTEDERIIALIKEHDKAEVECLRYANIPGAYAEYRVAIALRREMYPDNPPARTFKEYSAVRRVFHDRAESTDGRASGVPIGCVPQDAAARHLDLGSIDLGTVIYRRYVDVPYTVVAETPDSWILRYEGQPAAVGNVRLLKHQPLSEEWIRTKEEWEDWMFAWKYRDYVQAAIQHATPRQVREISKLLDLERWPK